MFEKSLVVILALSVSVAEDSSKVSFSGISQFSTVIIKRIFWGGSFHRTRVSLGSDLWVRLSVTHWVRDVVADLTDVTLADKDTDTILTDNANRAFQGNVATQVTQPGGQLWNQAIQLIWPDDQILNQFATNQKMHILKKYKIHFKKYCKSDVGKCKIWQG